MQRSVTSVLLVVLILAFGLVQASHVHGTPPGGPVAVAEQQATLTPVEGGSFCLICTLSVGFLATPVVHTAEISLTPCQPCIVLEQGDAHTTPAPLPLLRGPPTSSQLS